MDNFRLNKVNKYRLNKILNSKLILRKLKILLTFNQEFKIINVILKLVSIHLLF